LAPLDSYSGPKPSVPRREETTVFERSKETADVSREEPLAAPLLIPMNGRISSERVLPAVQSRGPSRMPLAKRLLLSGLEHRPIPYQKHALNRGRFRVCNAYIERVSGAAEGDESDLRRDGRQCRPVQGLFSHGAILADPARL